jgi:Tol biopolymer transport system component
MPAVVEARLWKPLALGTSALAAALSPDGGWLALVSSESGRDEIVVRPYPNVSDGRIQVSVDGGGEPRWSPAGDELFYRSFEGDDPDVMMAARVETEGGFRVVERTQLFVGRFRGSSSHPSYDVNADASAFVMVTALEVYAREERPSLHVLVDHFDVVVERALEGR